MHIIIDELSTYVCMYMYSIIPELAISYNWVKNLDIICRVWENLLEEKLLHLQD